ncbi:MAG: CPBP family intramembrane metalloprotease [Cyanobacteria bacterium J055]|nr:MAG: CPBP family intramembrane metalloprotease [Cyanobacteria bacterium J055]
MNLILDRILNSFSTVPTAEDWLYSVILLVVYAAIALPIGRKLNFLQFEMGLHPAIVLRMAIVAWIAPGLLEELVWRVCLIPHPTEAIDPSIFWFWVILSLCLFAIYHPLNFFVKHDTFKDPIFLLLATLLGVICTMSYLKSGSIWTPTFLHWAIIVVWLSFCGGYDKIHG